MITRRFTLLIALILLTFAGCTDEDTARDDASTTQQLITEEGGRLDAGEVVLDVPQGALSSATSIAVTQLSIASPVDAVALGSPVYRFEPAGLKFASPAEVSFTLSRVPGEGEGVIIYWTRDDAPDTFEVLTTRTEGATALASVEHFSLGFAGIYELACDADSDCPAGLLCEAGICERDDDDDCASGQAECGGACIDLSTDAANCGACGAVCAAGDACVAGACEAATPACSADSDCSAGEACVNGACETLAPPACNTDSDCPSGELCAASGVCQPGGLCADDSDCAAGQLCVRGACEVAGCPSGTTACGGACVD